MFIIADPKPIINLLSVRVFRKRGKTVEAPIKVVPNINNVPLITPMIKFLR